MDLRLKNHATNHPELSRSSPALLNVRGIDDQSVSRIIATTYSTTVTRYFNCRRVNNKCDECQWNDSYGTIACNDSHRVL